MPLDLAIRVIIGLDPEAVAARFCDFRPQAPDADREADAVPGLLQNHIARYGSITIDRLYEPPFTVVDADGLDGVFETRRRSTISSTSSVSSRLPPEGSAGTRELLERTS